MNGKNGPLKRWDQPIFLPMKNRIRKKEVQIALRYFSNTVKFPDIECTT